MDMWRKMVGLALALAVFAALPVSPAHTQGLGKLCPPNFTVPPHTTYICEFLETTDSSALEVAVRSNVPVAAAVVLPQYLAGYEGGDPGYALVSGSGMGFDVVFLLTGVPTLNLPPVTVTYSGTTVVAGWVAYDLVVQNSGAQAAPVSFMEGGGDISSFLKSMHNLTLPPGSSWCVPIPPDNFTPPAAPGETVPPSPVALFVSGVSNASVAYTVFNSSGPVFQSPYVTYTGQVGGGLAGYSPNFPPGNYTLMISNPHPFPVFEAYEAYSGMVKFWGGGPCPADAPSPPPVPWNTTAAGSSAPTVSAPAPPTSNPVLPSVGGASFAPIVVVAVVIVVVVTALLFWARGRGQKPRN